MELARLLSGRDGAENWTLSQLLAGDRGIVDPDTHHTVLPVIIARVEGGAFKALKRWEAVAGDPYLTRSRNAPAPILRVVS
jgi:branched-chain amino acid transport system substrate-binding protein